MIEQLLVIGLSNTIIALLLAIVATCIGAFSKRPHVADLLWIVVLVNLVNIVQAWLLTSYPSRAWDFGTGFRFNI